MTVELMEVNSFNISQSDYAVIFIKVIILPQTRGEKSSNNFKNFKTLNFAKDTRK